MRKLFLTLVVLITLFVSGIFAMRGTRATNLAHIPHGPLGIIILFSLGPCFTDDYQQKALGITEEHRMLWESLDDLDPLECDSEGINKSDMVEDAASSLEDVDVRSRLTKLRLVCREFNDFIAGDAGLKSEEEPRIARLYDYITKNNIKFIRYSVLRVFSLLLDGGDRRMQRLLGEGGSMQPASALILRSIIESQLPFVTDSYSRFVEKREALGHEVLRHLRHVVYRRDYYHKDQLPYHFVCGCFFASRVQDFQSDTFFRQAIINLLDDSGHCFDILDSIRPGNQGSSLYFPIVEYVLTIPGIQDTFCHRVNRECVCHGKILCLDAIAVEAIYHGNRGVLELIIRVLDRLPKEQIEDFFYGSESRNRNESFFRMVEKLKFEMFDNIIFYLYTRHKPSKIGLFMPQMMELWHRIGESGRRDRRNGRLFKHLARGWVALYERYRREKMAPGASTRIPNFSTLLLEFTQSWVVKNASRIRKLKKASHGAEHEPVLYYRV